jgi:hypothetical protein
VEHLGLTLQLQKCLLMPFMDLGLVHQNLDSLEVHLLPRLIDLDSLVDHRVHMGHKDSLKGHRDSLKVLKGHRDSLKVLKGHRDNLKVLKGHRDNLKVLKGHRDSLKAHMGHRDSLKDHRDSLKDHRDSLKVPKGNRVNLKVPKDHRGSNHTDQMNKDQGVLQALSQTSLLIQTNQDHNNRSKRK